MAKAVPFLNWTDEDFSWTWDSVPYDFSKKSQTLMEEWKSNFFAKHLTDRELLKAGLSTDHFRRNEFFRKCLPAEGTIEAPVSKLETEILNVKEEIPEKKKPGRPAAPKKMEEDTFEGLN